MPYGTPSELTIDALRSAGIDPAILEYLPEGDEDNYPDTYLFSIIVHGALHEEFYVPVNRSHEIFTAVQHSITDPGKYEIILSDHHGDCIRRYGMDIT